MRPLLAIALGVLAALASATCRATPSVSIELRPKARVAGPVVTLGEVALLHSADLPLMRTLVGLPLGPAPAAGEPVHVQREAVAGWLRARLGMGGAEVAWTGPAENQVELAAQTVRGEEIAAAAESALRETLAQRSERAEVQLDHLPHDVTAPDGALRLQPRSLAHASLRSHMVVWMDLWVEERFVRTVAVPFHVQAWRVLPVAEVALPAGAPLSPEQVAHAEIDVAAEAVEAPWSDSDAPVRTRHPVHAREALSAGNTEAMPAVQRGQWAALHSGAGLVRTEARVEVLQDGRIGDRVRVRQAGAAAGVLARVTAPGQLEIAP